MESTERRTFATSVSTQKTVSYRLLLGLFLVNILRNSQALNKTGIEITHVIGSDAVLTCTVTDLGSRRIIWNKLSDPVPISVGSTRFSPHKKYKVQASGIKSVLTIKNVRLEDAGEYQCRASGQVYLAETITLNIQTGTGNTYLLPSQTEVLSQAGGTALLPCHVENMNNNMVLWKNSHNEVLSLRKKLYSGDNRLKVVHDTASQWSLRIQNVKESDFGLYTCIINSQPVLTRTVHLKNSAPAQFPPILIRDSSYRKRVVVDAGDTVNLTCNFLASPPATVSWYRRRTVNGDENVKEDIGQGNTYTMRSVSATQGGQYICEADNGLKPVARGKTQLIVIAPPTAVPVFERTTVIPTGPTAPDVYPHQQKVGQRTGYDVEMKCSAIGLPRPQIDWIRHNIVLPDKFKHKYKITTENFRRDTLHSTLLVSSLSTSDFGNYSCVAYNTLGQHSSFIEVYRVT